MAQKNLQISYDFDAEKVSNSNTIEALGLGVMRLAAKATRFIDYRGLAILNRLIAKGLRSERMISVQLHEDTRFQFPYGDGYWGRLLDNKVPYSAAEENFLQAVRDIDYAYLDCGANFGYMSAIVTSKSFGAKPAFAIEADPENFAMLLQNWEANGRRFDLSHHAIFSKSGEQISMSGGKHEARAIDLEASDQASDLVETLKLDDLTEWVDSKSAAQLIIKLDVEGVEVDALKGAVQLLKRQPLVMFEDHGNDQEHTVSRYLFETLGYRIFVSEHSGCRELFTLDEIGALKTSRHVGYDFLAANGDYWPEKILSLRYA